MADKVGDYEAIRTRLGRLMTVGETADVLAVSRATVYRLFDDGLLLPIRVRSHVRIAEKDVSAFIERRQAETRLGMRQGTSES